MHFYPVGQRQVDLSQATLLLKFEIILASRCHGDRSGSQSRELPQRKKRLSVHYGWRKGLVRTHHSGWSSDGRYTELLLAAYWIQDTTRELRGLFLPCITSTTDYACSRGLPAEETETNNSQPIGNDKTAVYPMLHFLGTNQTEEREHGYLRSKIDRFFHKQLTTRQRNRFHPFCSIPCEYHRPWKYVDPLDETRPLST